MKRVLTIIAVVLMFIVGGCQKDPEQKAEIKPDAAVKQEDQQLRQLLYVQVMLNYTPIKLTITHVIWFRLSRK